MWIGDKLPTIYDVAQTIYHYAKGQKTQKRSEIITLYNKSLRNMLVRAFDEDHVVHRRTIQKTSHMTTGSFAPAINLRFVFIIHNKKWQTMDLPQNKRGQNVTHKISNLCLILEKTQNRKLNRDGESLLRRSMLTTAASP